jgi:hypothetical protein
MRVQQATASATQTLSTALRLQHDCTEVSARATRMLLTLQGNTTAHASYQTLPTPVCELTAR